MALVVGNESAMYGMIMCLTLNIRYFFLSQVEFMKYKEISSNKQVTPCLACVACSMHRFNILM